MLSVFDFYARFYSLQGNSTSDFFSLTFNQQREKLNGYDTT